MDRSSIIDTAIVLVEKLARRTEEDGVKGVAEALDQPFLDGYIVNSGIRIMRIVDGKVVEFEATIKAREVKERT